MNDISIGAIGAAFIAALVSLLGLVISKEQKTSEFRQAWIDSLRSEIVAYLASFNAIADALSVTYKDHGEKVVALSPLYSKFNEANFAIILRINPTEDLSKALMVCLQKFHDLASDEKRITAENIRPLEKEFLNSSKDLLKFEWNRVKFGELTFKITKIISIIIIFMILLFLISVNIGEKKENDKKEQSVVSVVNNVMCANNQAVPIAFPFYTGLPLCMATTRQPDTSKDKKTPAYLAPVICMPQIE